MNRDDRNPERRVCPEAWERHVQRLLQQDSKLPPGLAVGDERLIRLYARAGRGGSY